MGYSHYFEIRPGLSPLRSSRSSRQTPASIVKVSDRVWVFRLAGRRFDGKEGDVVINADEIMLDGVGAESAEPLHITREPQADAYDPVFNWCKTYRRNYSPVVEAVLMALKQAAPQVVMIGSNGKWGFEWLHGSHCVATPNGGEECLNTDPKHLGLGGRVLYSMAFPTSPEPMYAFESPLKGTVYENRTIHMPRDLDCKRWGSSFVGLPFGVTLQWLLDQARRKPRPICTLCGEPTETRTECNADYGYDWNTPMCRFCLDNRVLSGKLLGYSFAVNPFRLVSIAQPQLV